jgi:cytochrome c551/c552
MNLKLYTSLLGLLLALVMYSCSSPESDSKSTASTNSKDHAEQPVDNTNEMKGSEPGKDVFTSNGCGACHLAGTKSAGPAISTIANAYKGNEKGLHEFLLGEGAPIVDPAQEAVMKPQIGITKAMSEKDRQAVVDHILSF